MYQVVSAQDVKRIREKYGLSQQGFADLLGVGVATIARYEKGEVPNKAMSHLIHAAEKPEFVYELLRMDDESLVGPQRDRVEEIVYAMIDLDSDGHVMDMTDKYEISLQKEIMNEKAAGIMADIYRDIKKCEEENDDATAKFLEIVLFDIARLKSGILDKANSNTVGVNSLKACFDELEHLAKITVEKRAI